MDEGYIIIDLIVSLIGACFFGAVTQAINEKNGYEGGFWWGFFLGAIGIIVVALRQPYYTVGPYPSGDSICVPKKIGKTPIDMDAPVPDGGWRCLCGRVHEPYVSSCACGQSKRAVLDRTATTSRFEPLSLPVVEPPSPRDWTCTCGCTHPSYESSCICGKTKHEVLTANIILPDPEPIPIPETAPEPVLIPDTMPDPADDDQIIQSLRKYKELLDDGVITQEDYDAKKKQLLGL